MKHKLSPWFPANIKPIHAGPYQIYKGITELYAWWNGKKWGWLGTSIDEAFRFRSAEGASQNKPWRGIVK